MGLALGDDGLVRQPYFLGKQSFRPPLIFSAPLRGKGVKCNPPLALAWLDLIHLTLWCGTTKSKSPCRAQPPDCELE